MRRAVRLLAILAGVVLAIGVTAPSSFAAPPPYPPAPEPNCHVDPHDLPTTGGTVKLKGEHWKPGSSVMVTFYGPPNSSTTLTADAKGKISGTLSIPPSSRGRHPVQFTGQDQNGDGASCSDDVRLKSPKNKSAALPFVTGGSMLGLALVLFLGGMFIIRRRRESALKA